MKKRLIGSLLMGTLLVSSTSVFVSCKDYDDDINKNSSSIAAMQTQLSTLETALKEAQADAAAAKAAAEAANSSLDQKIAALLAQLENADEETKAVILQQIEDLKSNYATKAELAAAELKVSELEAVINQMKEQLNNTVSRDEMTLAIEKAIQDQIAAIDPSLLVGEWKAEVDARLNTYEGALAICQKQIENQRQVLNALIEALLGNDAAAARIRAALDAIDEDGNIDEETLEALKDRMQTISDVVDEIAPEGNVISLFVDRQLKSLVFIPQTYYWGVEAAKITRLMPQPYLKKGEGTAADWTMTELIEYIDDDNLRLENVGTSDWINARLEKTVKYTDTDKDRDATHDRYSKGTAIPVMLDATAEYHINPTSAKFDDDTKLNIVSANKDYTRAKGNAEVKLLGNADKATGLWTAEKGILSVPLSVDKAIGTVVNKNDGTPDNTNSGITTFAVQVQYGDTTVTSDYATIVEEIVKDLRLSHKPYKTTRTTATDFIQTGLLNTHCGQCDRYTLAGKAMGMHLFATVGEAKDFVESQKKGQDLVNYQTDINLTALIETHYTAADGGHALFTGENFTRNFKYKFELTDFRVSTGNKTNESAHAAIYQDEATGDYYLHPQDPQAGGLNGKPYTADKATEVVVGRVPLVRVSLIYNDGEKVVDYGYLPIQITKEAPKPPVEEFIYADYVSTVPSTVTRYNECYYEGEKSINAITTNWRDTEEDLLSHEAFTKPESEGGLGRALTHEEFENNYTALTNLNDLDQYYLTNEAAYMNNPQTVKPVFDAVANNPNVSKIGEIAYVQGSLGSEGLSTSILTWDLDASEVSAIATDNSWPTYNGDKYVIRAIKLESKAPQTYPHLYIIFVSGKISVVDKLVEANMNVTDHRINEYWYTHGNAPFQQGDVEIHTNVTTPEENPNRANMGDGNFHLWKPEKFANILQYVFENNFKTAGFVEWMTFSGQSSAAGQPFNTNNVELGIFFDDSNNGVILKGYTSSGDPKEFTISNTTNTDKSKKALYATQKGTTNTQKIATIEGNWIGTGTNSNIGALKQVTVQLTKEPFAKALLNYVDHEKIGEPNVLNATVAVLPLAKGAAPEVKTKDGKAYIENALKYTQNGETKYCRLYIKDYKFDVRYLRPVSISKLGETVIEDATATIDDVQVIKLSELVKGYTDFRGSETDPNWKTIPDYTVDYEEYYAPDGKNKFALSVQGVPVGNPLSDNPYVMTNLNQATEDTWVPLAQVASQIRLTMKSDDEIEYRNAGSTVQKFKIKIPVEVEYYWGTIYDDVIVTIDRTKANARRK